VPHTTGLLQTTDCLKEGENLWRPSVDGRIMLKCISEKQGVKREIEINWLRMQSSRFLGTVISVL
jgi:hypothetical protein